MCFIYQYQDIYIKEKWVPIYLILNDLSFLKMYCKTLFIKHILGTYYNTGTLCSGRTRPFWNYNIGITSKALESIVGWVPLGADPGTSTCVQLAHEGLASTETHEGTGAGGGGSEARVSSQAEPHTEWLWLPNPLTPQWSDKGILKGSWTKYQYYSLQSQTELKCNCTATTKEALRRKKSWALGSGAGRGELPYVETVPPPPPRRRTSPLRRWMNGKKRRMLTWLEVRSRPVRGAQEADVPQLPGHQGEVGKETISSTS